MLEITRGLVAGAIGEVRAFFPHQRIREEIPRSTDNLPGVREPDELLGDGSEPCGEASDSVPRAFRLRYGGNGRSCKPYTAMEKEVRRKTFISDDDSGRTW